MSELLKKQNYGVEVEFTGISRKMAADAVAEIIGTTASRPDHTCYQTRTIQDSQGRKWKVMRDSSINPIRKVGTENMDEYRVEFVTPVLKYEDLDTLQAIIRKFREIGGVPHASCGIHIHVDGANHTATSLRRLVNFMYSRQEIIYDAILRIEQPFPDQHQRYHRRNKGKIVDDPEHLFSENPFVAAIGKGKGKRSIYRNWNQHIDRIFQSRPEFWICKHLFKIP